MFEGYAYCGAILEHGRLVDWTYLEVNSAFSLLTGLADVTGQRVSEILPRLRELNPEVFEAYERVVVTGRPERFLTHIEPLQLWLSIAVTRPEAGCFLALFENVTERIRSEDALRQSESFVRSTLDSLASHIAVVDASGEILTTNSAWRSFAAANGGEGRELCEGANYLRVCEAAAAAGCSQAGEFAAGLRAVLAGELPGYELEYSCHAPGDERWFLVRVTPVGNGWQRAVVAHENITHRVLAERQVRESLGRYASVVETSTDALFINRDDRIVQVNPAALRLFGAERAEQILGRSPFEFIHPEGHAVARRRIAEMLERGEAAAVSDQRIVALDGSVRDVEVAAAPFLDQGSLSIHVMMRDVTQRVAVDRALSDERARLRTVLDTIPDLVWLKDPDGVYLSCNAAFARSLGRTEAEIVGRTDVDLYPGELVASYRFHDLEAMQSAASTVIEERIPSREGGPEGLFETIKTPVRGPGQRPLGVLGIARDVTRARAAAEALRQSEERLRLFIEHAPVALAMFDREMRYLGASRRWRSDYGLGDQSLRGLSHYALFPTISESWREEHRRALAGEVVTAGEERLVRADGSMQWLKREVHPWRDHQGVVAGIVIFTEDVTEGRLSAEKLAESEAHYRSLAETTFDWIWEVDAEGRYTFVSPRVRELLGYAPEEILGTSPFALMPQEEAERVGALFWDSVLRREPFANLENVNRHKDGRLVVLESSGVPYFGPEGDFRGYRGMDRDITARKWAERRLATQAEVSRVLASSSSLLEAAPGILKAIGESEGWAFGAVWECDRGASTLSCVAWWAEAGQDAAALGERSSRLRLGRGEGFPGQIWAEGRPRAVNILPDGASYRRQEEAAALGLRGAVGFPIRLGDEVLGVVEFLGGRMDDPDFALREVFEAVGRQIGLFVERRRSEATVRRFVSGSPAVIYALRVEPAGQRLVWFSDNLEQMTGWKTIPDNGAVWWMENIHPEDLDTVQKSFAVPYELEHQVLEFRFRTPDGRYLWVRDERRLLRDAAGQPAEIVGSWSDITERVELEEKLRVAQKLEAIGRLAGGVAHDFNNMLMIISGNSEILDRALPAEGSERALLSEIREAAERSANLTRQLLAFSRTQVLAPRVLPLAAVVTGVETMLRRLIGEDILLVCELDPGAGHVLVDRSQLEQVIVNLAVNARDAMPRGGTLWLKTSAVDLDERACRRLAGLVPGAFACLEVRDTGSGMRPEVLERIFEPFFTTKPVGMGTGLGLSTAFGILRQSGGHIDVSSTEGEGTSFLLYLPQVAAPALAEPAREAAVPASRGRETVLVVEDEAGVRRLVRLALERQGYKLLVASSGREAVALVEQHAGPIDLLLTDLVMPEMSGSELAEILRARLPGLAVLLMSGYVQDDFVRHGVVTEEVTLLHKPFTLADLAAKVRETLDAAYP